MATRAFVGDRAAKIPRPERTLAGKVAIAALALLAVGALAGGVALVTDPDGSGMGWDLTMLAGSPFADFLVPGLILGGLFGAGSFGVAAMGLARLRIAPFLAFAIGCGQMIWIVVELAVIGQFSFLHPACFGLGLVIAATSVRWGWPTYAAWREARRDARPRRSVARYP
jgi:hypothetical protein